MEYKCNYCNKDYSSYSSLWNHNKKFHNNKICSNNTSVILNNTLDNTSIILNNTLNNISKKKFNEKQILCSFVGNITANHITPNVRMEMFNFLSNNNNFKLINSGGWSASVNKNLQDILNDIKSNKILWNHDSLSEYIKEEEEQDDFIVNPFQIEEGIVECRCGSKRVYSYSKQCRSGDEGVTSFHQCLKCKAKWSLNN